MHFRCGFCPLILPIYTDWEDHQLKAHWKQVHCHTCGKYLKTVEGRRAHYWTTHPFRPLPATDNQQAALMQTPRDH